MDGSRKRRRPIADSEKKALRDYFYKTCAGKASGKQCQQWFLGTYKHKLAESSIFEILRAEKYIYLDEDITGPDRKRARQPQWPGLEIALFNWQKRMEKKTFAVNGDVLKATAAKLWTQLAQFKDLVMPKWSNG
jgi:hypothetical protein